MWGGVGAEGEEKAVKLEAINADGTITGSGMTCGVLICNRCGFVRLHAAQALDAGFDGM
jgi:hypothetical protein